MSVDPAPHLRIARPVRSLAVSRDFWLAVGMVEQFSKAAADGFPAMCMLGFPGAGWHLELLEDPDDLAACTRGEHDQLILYLGDVVPSFVFDRILAGGARRRSLNSYWDPCSVVVTDPDGWTVVLTSRTWNS